MDAGGKKPSLETEATCRGMAKAWFSAVLGAVQRGYPWLSSLANDQKECQRGVLTNVARFFHSKNDHSSKFHHVSPKLPSLLVDSGSISPELTLMASCIAYVSEKATHKFAKKNLRSQPNSLQLTPSEPTQNKSSIEL
jgi:hypothetical protein